MPRRERASRPSLGTYVETDDRASDYLESGSEDERRPGKVSDTCFVCKAKIAAGDANRTCTFATPTFTCPHARHERCHDDGEDLAGDAEWTCAQCVPRRDLDDVERILSLRVATGAAAAAPAEARHELFIKRTDHAYLHSAWVPEAHVALAAQAHPGLKGKYRKFMQRVAELGGVEGLEAEEEDNGLEGGINPEWLMPDRVIAAERDKAGRTSYLFKWKGLDYDECTWEEEEDVAENDLEGAVAAFHALRPIEDAAAELAAKHAKAEKATRGRGAAGAAKADARTYDATPAFLSGGALHPYQLDGLNWLLLRVKREQNMILADEMGLGKTVQTIALLASLRQTGNPHPHLVVVPLSTLPNWERELTKWAPGMYTVSLKGNADARRTIRKFDAHLDAGGRKRREAPVRFSVMLTTYEVMQQEASWLKGFHWATLTVDEGHRLKNSKSRLYSVLTSLTADRRLLLSGTPLQNNLEELFMLMHFIEPGKFADLAQFQAAFSDLSQEAQVQQLHALLQEHILRRVKRDVLTQMPPKREQIVRVEMSAQQRDFYKRILVRQFPVLRGAGVKGAGLLKNVMMELRKCCNHPVLFDERGDALDATPVEDLVAASGKLQLLDRMMPVMKQRGHRVLIYSQFTRTLDVLETWLHRRGWGYQRVDGGVRGGDRQLRIDRFNNEPAAYWVFLLSTRAGGVGINLATADTVVIFDSDWNPHNDIQAQARAHRLGQRNAVFTYRFVTRSTVEERIMQRAKEKRVLEKVVMGKQGLGADELQSILECGAAELFAEEGAAAARRITYDDAALDALLDREARLAEKSEDEDEGDGFMAAFKVANFEMTEAEAEAEAAKEAEKATPAAAPATGARLWEALLSDQYGALQQVELASMGRGRRTRKPINYAEDGGLEAQVAEARRRSLAAAAAAGGAAARLAGAAGRADEDADWQPEAGEAGQLPPRCEGDPASAEWLICGLDATARHELAAFLHRYGLPLTDALKWDWGAFARKVRQLCPALARASRADIAAYGEVLLTVLYSLTDHLGGGSYETHRPVRVPRHTLRAPCHQFLGVYEPGTLMAAVGRMHLVRTKLWRYEATRRAGGGELQVAHSGPRDEQWMVHMHALVAPRGCKVVSSGWSAEADRTLLQGVAKYGLHSAWRAIRTDADLGMARHCDATVTLAAAPPAAASGAAPAAHAAARASSQAVSSAGLAVITVAAEGSEMAGRCAAANGAPVCEEGARVATPDDTDTAQRSQKRGRDSQDAAPPDEETAAADGADGSAKRPREAAAASSATIQQSDTAEGAAGSEVPQNGAATADRAAACRDVKGSAAGGAAAPVQPAADANAGSAENGGATTRDAEMAAGHTGAGQAADGAAGGPTAGGVPVKRNGADSGQPQGAAETASGLSRLHTAQEMFLQRRLALLESRIATEASKWPAKEIKYADGLVFEQPLLLPPLAAQLRRQLQTEAQRVRRMHEAVIKHTAQSAQEKQDATQQAHAAGRFRTLLQQYNAGLGKLHQAALAMLTPLCPGGVPTHCVAPVTVVPAQRSRLPARPLQAHTAGGANVVTVLSARRALQLQQLQQQHRQAQQAGGPGQGAAKGGTSGVATSPVIEIE